MKKVKMSNKTQAEFWALMCLISGGMLLAVVLTFISDFLNCVFWGI